MGKLMLYGAGRSLNCLLLDLSIDAGTSTVPAFKNTSGTEFTKISNLSSLSNNNAYQQMKSHFMLFNGWAGVCSADVLADFNVSQYVPNGLDNMSYTRTNSVTSSNRIYTVTAKNNGASAVTVNSIQFTKSLVIQDGGVAQTMLVAGYFLNTPVTIEAGKTKTFAVNIDCWNY